MLAWMWYGSKQEKIVKTEAYFESMDNRSIRKAQKHKIGAGMIVSL